MNKPSRAPDPRFQEIDAEALDQAHGGFWGSFLGGGWLGSLGPRGTFGGRTFRPSQDFIDGAMDDDFDLIA